MTYKEQLQTARKHGLDILNLTVADKVEQYFADHTEITDELFEQLCSFAEYMYLKSEDSLSSIVVTIQQLVETEGYTFNEVFSLKKWDFLDKVAHYFPYN